MTNPAPADTQKILMAATDVIHEAWNEAGVNARLSVILMTSDGVRVASPAVGEHVAAELRRLAADLLNFSDELDEGRS